MVCQGCGKELIRGYAFCMDCGAPVPPEILEEGGLPGRTGDHADNPAGKSETLKSDAPKEQPPEDEQGSMPEVVPLTFNVGGDDENTDGKTLVFCPNCGTNMQADPHKCEKCGIALSSRASSVPMFNSDELSQNNDLSDEVGADLTDMLGGDLSSEDELNPESEKMFGSLSGGVSGISESDLYTLTQQMSMYSAGSKSEMPAVGLDMPEEPEKTEKSEESKKSEKIESKSIESIKTSYDVSGVDLSKSEPPAEAPKPGSEDIKAPIAADVLKPQQDTASDDDFIPESGGFTETPFIAETPEDVAEPRGRATAIPMQDELPQPTPKNADPEAADYDPEEELDLPAADETPNHMPRFTYIGIIVVIICLALLIIMLSIK